ncbi:MAG: transporter substrate-binding domain-containing protein, partial [Bacteroidales bacterium]|nr:transporter substrate-binding domain-containing protein [Bacteroidales bacterium]
MKKSILLYSAVAAAMILLLTQCMKWTKEDTYDFDLQFLTEDYKPLNYVENSAITGLAPAVLAGIVDQLSIPCYVNVLPWNTAYALALKSDNAVLFSTIMNAERKDLFKWAGPIISLDCMFYASSQSNISLNSLDDAKTVARIGILKDYAIEQYLTAKGFTNFSYCADDNDAFDKLLKGQIDLFPADRITAAAALTELGKSIYSVTPKLTIKTDLMYFAFNKNVPDRVVADFQKIIDQYKTDGTLKTLTQQFLGTSDFPGILQIYTEQYPPLTYRNNSGEITGFGTDIVSEIMQRNQVFADIKLTSWNNGYELALDNPNVCLFTMDRTPIRENLFQWVGPIGTNTTWFYTKAGSGITLTSLADAKNLSSVGTVTS